MNQLAKINKNSWLESLTNRIGLNVNKKHKTLNNGGNIYDTGIVVKPPEGYYVEILTRSSISNTGITFTFSKETDNPNPNFIIYLVFVYNLWFTGHMLYHRCWDYELTEWTIIDWIRLYKSILMTFGFIFLLLHNQ